MNEQQRFQAWITERNPELARFWDWSTMRIKPDEIDLFLGVASSGEKLMLKFYLGVWFNTNRYEFDLIDAVGVLDQRNIQTITDWMKDPIWP